MSIPVPTTSIRMDNLTGRGKGQYFYHDSQSALPIRDISNKGKTEPYIEYGRELGIDEEFVVGAENYCSECLPDDISSFLRSDRRYLFLMTNPNDRNIGRQIVGFMRKDDYDYNDEGDFLTLIGKTELYNFDDAIRAEKLGKDGGRSGHLFDYEETEYVLNHFEGRNDVTEACVDEILRFKEEYGQDESAKDDSYTCGGC